jgi:hypothetical protein
MNLRRDRFYGGSHNTRRIAPAHYLFFESLPLGSILLARESGPALDFDPMTQPDAAPRKPTNAALIAASNAFYAHLDICAQCEQHPFDLCSVGVRLLVACGEAAKPRRANAQGICTDSTVIHSPGADR